MSGKGVDVAEGSSVAVGGSAVEVTVAASVAVAVGGAGVYVAGVGNTGSAVAVFTGRRYVAGMEHNRAVLLEGVARSERGRLVMLNPAYTLLPR